MERPIVLFLGASGAWNVRNLVDNLAAMLPSRTLHLVTAARDTLEPVAGDRITLFGDSSGTLLSAVRTLERYLRSNDPAVLVQLTDPPVHGTIVSSVGSVHGVPTVYRYSGDRFWEYRVARGREKITAFGLGAILGRLPLRLATNHVALGPVGRQRLVDRGVAANEITVLPPTVDPTRFEEASPHPELVSAGREVVVTIGRLSHLKGAETVERVIPSILDRRQDLEYLHVGTLDRPLELADTYEDRVTYAGPVSPAAIPDYIATASLVFHPSLTEGVPRVLLESLAAGTPVLARAVGDVPSVTENTFTTDEECIEMICRNRPLPLDDVEPFTRETLAPRYRAFFERFQ